jgi:transcriptional regulator with XRE-family HTH domain
MARREIGKRLEKARIAAAMDGAKLARLSGFSEAQIEAWEKGPAVLYPAEMLRLCHVLDVTSSTLLGWP